MFWNRAFWNQTFWNLMFWNLRFCGCTLRIVHIDNESKNTSRKSWSEVLLWVLWFYLQTVKCSFHLWFLSSLINSAYSAETVDANQRHLQALKYFIIIHILSVLDSMPLHTHALAFPMAFPVTCFHLPSSTTATGNDYCTNDLFEWPHERLKNLFVCDIQCRQFMEEFSASQAEKIGRSWEKLVHL